MAKSNPLNFSLDKVKFRLEFETPSIKNYTAEAIVRSFNRSAILGKAYLTLQVYYNIDTKTIAHANMQTVVIFSEKSTTIKGYPHLANCLFPSEVPLVLPEGNVQKTGMLMGAADAFSSSCDFCNFPGSTMINILEDYWEIEIKYSNVNLANL